MTWEARFARKDCTPCLHRAQCTRAKKEPRLVGLQAREQYEALHAARQRQTTDAFAQQYAPRAGIEGTHAQGIRPLWSPASPVYWASKDACTAYSNRRGSHRGTAWG